MVKPDSSKDYYRDLGIDPTADSVIINKAYKKLAMLYHPDRNNGRETEVTAQFQAILEAHEVLKDAGKRRQYDTERASNPSSSRNRYQSGGNQRGNPWSNVSSQYPAPPKAPTARSNTRPNPPPPPSAGAQRYSRFETPKQSAHATAQEGAEGRKSTYEAWEHMRGSSSGNRPPPPPREESTKSRPPRTRAGFGGDFGGTYDSPGTPPRRAQSTSASSRKGFVPNTPGGDESPAPRGAYFTTRKSAQAPPPPPRNQPPASSPDIPVDPLHQFRNKPDAHFESRQSTPYATHGGEKFDPFQSAFKGGLGSEEPPNINRSKSQREPRDRTSGAPQVPRAGSDSNLNSPSRSQSHNFGGQRKPVPKPTFSTPDKDSDTSSSDTGPEISSRTFAKPKGSKNPRSSASAATSSDGSYGKNVPNGPTQANPQTNGDPSMYGPSPVSYPSQQRPSGSASSCGARLPTVIEDFSSPDYFMCRKNPVHSGNLYSSSFQFSTPPSGVSGHKLFPLEEAQRSVLDEIIKRRNGTGARCTATTNYLQQSQSSNDAFRKWRESIGGESPFKEQRPTTDDTEIQTTSGTHCGPQPELSFREKHPFMKWRDPALDGSPSKKQRYSSYHLSFASSPSSQSFWNDPADGKKRSANFNGVNSFTMPVQDNTFQPNASTSSENINMKFSPHDWTGTFEGNGGASYFAPEPKAANMNHNTRSRTHSSSGTRSRGRSPNKPGRPVDSPYTHAEAESPGTKFSQAEWAKTFKDPTFVAPPPPSNVVPPRNVRQKSARSFQANPVPVPESHGVEAKTPPRNIPSASAAAAPSPDAMDVDTPPVMIPTPVVPNVGNTSPKRPAPGSNKAATSSTAELKVEFEDLSVGKIISSMALPSPPIAPKMPTQSLSMEPYHQYMVLFRAYMKNWDLFNTRMLLHFVTRKNINEGQLGDKRWTDELVSETYRMGEREDRVVSSHWASAREGHFKAVKDCAVVRATMSEFGESVDQRPRKKQS